MVFVRKWGRKENKNNKVFNHKGVDKKKKKKKIFKHKGVEKKKKNLHEIFVSLILFGNYPLMLHQCVFLIDSPSLTPPHGP